MTQFQLGSISTGTLRTQDLLPAFLETLTARGGKVPDDLECGTHIEYLNWPSLDTTACDDDDKFWDSEDAMWDMEALTDALQTLCPPFVYFGTLEGDGSDFGFWPDWDSIQSDVIGNAEIDTDHADYMTYSVDSVSVTVYENGNVTVMDMERNVLWSVV
jgi:hypothetical protein